MSEPSLFDYLNDISTHKQHIFNLVSCQNYNAFMINRGLGQHIDTIMLANEMNKRSNVSKEMHHDFLYYSVDAKKRYGKWAKQDTTDLDLLEYLQSKYVINKEHALEYLEMLDKTEVKKLKLEAEQKGGIQK